MTLDRSRFSRTFTGNAFGDFLEGAPTTLFFAVSSPDVAERRRSTVCLRRTSYQVNSRLTLSYGLRWQVLPGFQEDGGNLANFDQRNNSIVVPDALAAYLAKQQFAALESGVSAVVQCVQSEQHGTALHEVCDGEPGWVAAEFAQYL